MADQVSWFPVLTLLLGFGTKSLADWWQDRRLTQREREAREAAQRERLLERRVEFQRETLLALQDAVMSLTRATGAANHQDEIAARDNGQWQKQLLPDDLDEQLRQAQALCSILASRVRDQKIRELTDALKGVCATAAMSRSQRDAADAIQGMGLVFQELNATVGALLRELDDAEGQV
ncbi:MAG: hypothetical protein WDN04_14325 [Rhodospirillales bacterium]